MSEEPKTERERIIAKARRMKREILRRCDAVLMVGAWEKSVGASAEFAEATLNKIPVFVSQAGLKAWLSAHA